MRKIELGDSGLRCPVIGFGCAALLGRTGKRDSVRALHAAWDEGIRLFDTARSYGYGESETLLGSFLRGRRDDAIVVTKFGILPARQSRLKTVAKSGARALVSVAPFVRPLMQKAAAREFIHGQFTVHVLRNSIEESLRKLCTDRVDILFLHAAPASVLQQDDLLDAMGRLVSEGKVRLAGLSADPDVVGLALERSTRPLRAMQFPCNIFDLPAAHRFGALNPQGHVLMGNQPFGGPARVQKCREILNELAHDPSVDPELRAKLTPLDDDAFADAVFSCILRDTGIHVVISAMMKVKHVKSNTRATTMSRFTSIDIREIRKGLAAHGRGYIPVSNANAARTNLAR